MVQYSGRMGTAGTDDGAKPTVPFRPGVQSLVTINSELNTTHVLSWVTGPIEQCIKNLLFFKTLKSEDIVFAWTILDIPLLVVVLTLSDKPGVASHTSRPPKLFLLVPETFSARLVVMPRSGLVRWNPRTLNWTFGPVQANFRTLNLGPVRFGNFRPNLCLIW